MDRLFPTRKGTILGLGAGARTLLPGLPDQARIVEPVEHGVMQAAPGSGLSRHAYSILSVKWATARA
ncbi:hypothetical protein [Streptomyces sp. NPDC003996]